MAEDDDPISAAFGAAERMAPEPDGDPDGDPGGPPAGSAGAADEADRFEAAVKKCLREPLNDYGNGQRLFHLFGHELIFVPRVSWFVWDANRWAPDEDGLRLRTRSHKVAAGIRREAELIQPSKKEAATLERWRHMMSRLEALRGSDERSDAERKELLELEELARIAREIETAVSAAKKARRGHAKNAGETGRIGNMAAEAKPYLFKGIEEMNADPLRITVRGATLRFIPAPKKQGPGEDFESMVEALPPAREDYITKLAPVEWIGEAEPEVFSFDPKTAPNFWAFLCRIQPKESLRGFLQRWFGYNILGLTSEQKLVFFYGIGRNGKSTLVDVVARILGDYATTLPIESLTGADQRKGADATPDLVRLPGARMVRASEPEEGVKLKEALIKALTGGEEVLIRRMREEFVSITPEFKLTISGNHKPAVRGTDDGIWRRLLLVPFEEQIPKDQIDPALPAKLWAERDEIFAWMVEGALRWLDGGLQEPEEVLEATKEFREERDFVARFFDRVCQVTGEEEDRVSAAELVAAFNFWLRDNGEATWGERAVSNALRKAVGPPPTYRNAQGRAIGVFKSSKIFYTGLRLEPDFQMRFADDRASGARK